MSFSSDVKKEVGKLNNLAKKQQIENELIGYLISSNTSKIDNKKIKFSTESDYNINRISKILSNLDIEHNIEMKGKWFVITIPKNNLEWIFEKIENKNSILKQESEEDFKAIIRGAFLGSGSINNPENKYHLEITLSNKDNMEFIKNLISKFEIKVKSLDNSMIYIKEGEEISKFLALIGASNAVMKFEDIRVSREMRGKVNRLVNCETANLNKTLNASVIEIEAIEKLKKEKRFNKLDDKLKEMANLRLQNPDISLVELGKLTKPPVGKSGVHYRLKKIVEIANE